MRKKIDPFLKQMIENGEASYFEIRIMEYMSEAKRTRELIEKSTTNSKRELYTEEFRVIMEKTETALKILRDKVSGKPKRIPKKVVDNGPQGT